MLDVHPPHSPTHTWKDFFIHIATIVVGLLIAVGIEQMVEYFHHRHQLKEVRAQLTEERELDRLHYNFNVASFRYVAAQLTNDILVFTYIKQHPGTPMEKLPGTLRWSFVYSPAREVTWKTAQQNGITPFMRPDEVTGNVALYKELDLSDESAIEVWNAIGKAQQFSPVDPDPSHLSPSQVDSELHLLGAAMDANYRWGLLLFATNGEFPDFTPTPSVAELSNLLAPGLADEQRARLAAPNAITDSRLASMRAALDKASAMDSDFTNGKQQK